MNNVEFAHPRDHAGCNPESYCEHEPYEPRVPQPPATAASALRLAAENEFALRHLRSVFHPDPIERALARGQMARARKVIAQVNRAGAEGR